MGRLGALATLCLLAGCAAASETRTAQRDTPSARPVTVADEPRAPSAALRLPGLIAPVRSVSLSSPVNAPVTAVYANEGDTVAQGQLLAQVDTSELQANLVAGRRSAAEADLKASQAASQARLAIVQGVDAWRTAQDGVAQAASKLRHDKESYDRVTSLAATGDVPQQQADDARTLVVSDAAALRSAVAALHQARETVGVNGTVSEGLQRTTIEAAQAAAGSAHAQVDQLEAQIAKASVRAPFNGVVVARAIDVGEYPGTRALFTIQATGDVYALLTATASQLGAVRRGRAVRVAAARSGIAGDGTVEAILPASTPGSTSFTVKVRVPNAGGRFMSGMVVTGEVR